MPLNARALAIAIALCVGWGRGGVLDGAARAQEAPDHDQPSRVITATREYCDRLVELAETLRDPARPPPAAALMLATEGQRLCTHGQIRPGVTRLRRAIVMLRAAKRHSLADD